MGEEVVIVTTSSRGGKVKQPLESAGRTTSEVRIERPTDVPQISRAIDNSTGAVIVDSLGFPLMFTRLAKLSHDFSLILRLRGEGIKEYKEEIAVENTPRKLYASTKIVSTHLGAGGIDGCIPVSKHVKHVGLQQGLCSLKDPVVPTPMLADVDSPSRTRVSNERVDIAVVTNFDYWDKIKSLPALFSCKRWETVGVDPRITIYGDGKYLNKVASKVDKDYIRFEGFENDIYQKMTGSDVFLYITEQDGYPSTVVEAQYLGLPVVANRYGPIPEQISHRHDGLLYSLDNMCKAVDLVEEVVYDRSLYTRLSQNGYRTARTRNSVGEIGRMLNQAVSKIRN